MTIAQIAALLLEPRVGRYVGRHRAPQQTRVVPVARLPRLTAMGAATTMGAPTTTD